MSDDFPILGLPEIPSEPKRRVSDYSDLVPIAPSSQKITLDATQRLTLGLVALLLMVLTGFMLQLSTYSNKITILSSDLNTSQAKLDEVQVKLDDILAKQDDILANQADSVVRGYKLRAVSCQAVAFVVPTSALPDICLEPEVLQFYDPEQTLPDA